MSAKTVQRRGHHALNRWVALRDWLSCVQSSLGHLCHAAQPWPGIANLDARQLRDIGLPAEWAHPPSTPTAIHGIIGAPPVGRTNDPPSNPSRSAGKSAAFALAAAVLGLSIGNAAPDGQKSEADIIRGVLPSVVNLTVSKPDVTPATPGEARTLAQYYGSGFVVDRSGLILTNRHVVEGADSIAVTFADGTHARAELCAMSGQVDLAVIKVRARTELIPATWGDSDRVRMGDRVLAIGNPLGVGVSVSAGIVSALHRHVSSNPFDDFVQTDAAINHGNSGGMLVNGAGELVGVNTAFLSDRANGGSLGVGFAIPVSEAMQAVRQLKDCNPQPSGWIGVTLQQVTPEIAPALGLSQPIGSIVTGVAADSPAGQAGLQEGDVLERLGEEAEPTPVQMLRRIAMAPVGTVVRIIYRRLGHAAEATLTVARWPDQRSPQPGQAQSAAMRTNAAPHGLGLQLVDEPGPSNGSRVVVRSIDRRIAAADAGLQSGDAVLRIGRQPAISAETVRSVLCQQMEAGQSSVLLLVESGQTRRWIAMPLG